MALNNVYLFRKHAESKKIDIINHIKMDTIGFFDYNMIDTVFRNLISNAIKFTDVNGKIELYADSTEKLLIINVKDTGIGIKPENLDKLFRIDKSFSTSGTHKEKGTGLGLILCKEFIEKNNGIISISSEFGKGTTFSFTLPKY